MSHMQNQPTINIGTIGHVSNGKTTTVKCISGIATQKHSSEKMRNITIKLGYANAKIFKCGTCNAPECYQPASSETIEHMCNICDEKTELVRHVSFIDVPGHSDLTSVMLSGTCVMDTTILIESVANKEFPAPQSMEHVYATNMRNISKSIVCLNKIDLIEKKETYVQIEKLKQALKTYDIHDIPIIPIAANINGNIDVLCEYICTKINIPERDLTLEPKMIVIRSFNINRSNKIVSKTDLVEGGIVGGTIVQGKFKVGDKIAIYPGIVIKNDVKTKNPIFTYCPIKCTIESINSDKNNLQEAIPGGLIGVKLDVDPTYTIDDRLVGHVMKLDNANTMHEKVYERLEIKFQKLDRHVDLNQNLNVDDIIVINCNAFNTGAKVIKFVQSDGHYILKLDLPICVINNDSITISKKVSQTLKILGIGTIIDGYESNKII